jgi:SAM-dependent methyltransferase
MTADEKITPAARVAALLERGPATVSRRSVPQRLRALLRGVLLRAARPHARYQREIDQAVLASLEHLEAELVLTRERHTEQIDRLEVFAREFVFAAESLRRRVSSVEPIVEPIAADLYALPYIADAPFEPFGSPVGEVLGFRSSPIRDGESGYVAFEEVFRGPPERVADSQRPYLQLVEGHAPVLDVGCGRGEFLALLREQAISARGVDLDEEMVRRCRELGLDAIQEDANTYLETLPDETLGTVFSAQFIEHLPAGELHRMLGLAVRKLRPGGLLIAETINPHRVSSMKTFWVDLTHQHPIFPEVALTMCAIAGFESAYVFGPGFRSYERSRFEAPSYAVVAATSSTKGEK